MLKQIIQGAYVKEKQLDVNSEESVPLIVQHGRQKRSNPISYSGKF